MVHAPSYNINGSLVNVDGSNYSGSAFTSRVIPSQVNPNVMPEPLSNIQAANSYIPCGAKGGGVKKGIMKLKIKKILSQYKMAIKKSRSSKRKMFASLKRKVKSILKTKKGKSRRKMSKKTKKSKKRVSFQKGGYSQYQNNLPLTQTYSLGGPLNDNLSALANPPPYQTLSNCTNCVDNYSRFTNSGFPSRGSY